MSLAIRALERVVTARCELVAADPCGVRRNAVPASDLAAGVAVLERRSGDVPSTRSTQLVAEGVLVQGRFGYMRA